MLRLAKSRPLGERSEPSLAAKRAAASGEVARGPAPYKIRRRTFGKSRSCWVPLFPELLLSVLHSIALCTDDVTKTYPQPFPPPPPHRDSDKHWSFLLDVPRTLYGNAQFAISSARRFSVFRRVPVSKFEERPRKYKEEQIKTLLKCKGFKQSRK